MRDPSTSPRVFTHHASRITYHVSRITHHGISMNPDLGLAWFRIAIFFTLVSGVLLFLETPGTAEFVITVASFIIGLIFLAIIAIIVRWSNR
jgi:hypothetical protein